MSYHYDLGNAITASVEDVYFKRPDLWGEYQGRILHVIHQGPQEGHDAHVEDIVIALMNIKDHICICTVDEPTGYIGSIGVKMCCKRFPEYTEVFKAIYNVLTIGGQEVV